MTTLATHLLERQDEGFPAELVALLLNIAEATIAIATTLRTAAISGLTGTTAAINVQGETQKPLDLLANDIFLEACRKSAAVSFAVSEELDEEVVISEHGGYAVIFDPLDGSSNLDVNVTVGSIFSIVPATSTDDLFKSGRRQVVAAYAAYGSATNLVLTTGAGVQIFTLAESGDYVLTSPDVRISPDTLEFAINAARRNDWDDAITGYIDDCIDGNNGNGPFNMRWVGSMVADIHRILNRGGIFLYPASRHSTTSGGRLRLLYEANPMSMLVEAAGGRASSGRQDILDVVPEALHQRVPVILGSANEVIKVRQRYQDS